MAGFPLIQLPGYQATNALNFAPINDAIDSNRQNALAQRQMGLQEQRNALMVKQDDRAAQSHGFDMAARQREQDMATARRGAGIVQHIKGLPPEQQSVAWQHALKTEFKDLSPDLHDFARAAPLIEAKAAEYIGQKDRAEIEYKQAQAFKARQEGAEGARGYAAQITPYQLSNGQIWGVQAGKDGTTLYHDMSNPGTPPLRVPVGGRPPVAGLPPPGAPAMGQQPGMPQGAPQQGGQPVTQRPSGPLTPFRARTVVGGDVFDPGRGVFDRGAAEGALERGEIAKGRGDALVKLETTLPKARATLEAANVKSDLVRNKIAQALPMVSNWTTGYGSVLANWPATAARDFKGITDTIIANLGFDELQEMRTNSPTGGALGAIAVQELEMLTRTKASLEQAQTPQQVTKALQELDRFYAAAGPRRQRAFEETYAPLNRRTGNSPLVTGPSVPRQFNDRLPPSGGPAPGVQGMIPPQAVQFLRGNPSPEIIQQFEAKYGPGSARQFMGGQ